MIRKTAKYIIPNTTNCLTSAPGLDPFAWHFPGLEQFFCDLVFGTSAGGNPWTDVGLPWGTSGPIVFTFLKKLGAIWLQLSKIPGQHFDTS